GEQCAVTAATQPGRSRAGDPGCRRDRPAGETVPGPDRRRRDGADHALAAVVLRLFPRPPRADLADLGARRRRTLRDRPGLAHRGRLAVRGTRDIGGRGGVLRPPGTAPASDRRCLGHRSGDRAPLPVRTDRRVRRSGRGQGPARRGGRRDGPHSRPGRRRAFPGPDDRALPVGDRLQGPEPRCGAGRGRRGVDRHLDQDPLRPRRL
ncbi:MAG: hypothetical protein AVDCRST_MAG70-1393, partial [uncultured Thermomicrobiales bacterium]